MQSHCLVAALLLLQLWPTTLSLNPEVDNLLKVKSSLDDPNNALANWNPTDSAPCSWTGVNCSTPAGDIRNPTVTSVNLTGLDLSGRFPVVLCLLPNLTFLSLSFNYINSSLPDSSLTNCSALTHLDLSQNLLVGPLPSLSSLRLLRHLDFAGNNFSGAIPRSYAHFPSLEILSLTANLLDETIPSFLGSISSLRQLNLSYNPFSSGPIPPTLAKLANLDTLWLAGCGLIGEIPPSLGRLSKLTNLDLSANSLTGGIPETLSGLSSVIQIELYSNNLTGGFPSGLSKLTALRRIDAAMNSLSGPIPDDVFSIPQLSSLHLYRNQFNGSLPATAAMADKLVELRIFSNKLSGALPANLGSNSLLMFLDLSDNQLTGEIPKGICNGGVLKELLLFNNYLSGSLPQGLGQCRTLTRIRLANNQLSGTLESLGLLSELKHLDLRNNSFSGGIPQELGSLPVLNYLDLSGNVLTGEIPIQLENLNLTNFNLSNNLLSGPIPPLLRKESYRTSFLGNPGLCWDPNGVCPGAHAHRKFLWLVGVILLVAIVGISLFYLRCRNSNRGKRGMEKSWWVLHSFHKLGFGESEILNSLHEDNVIGNGASGKVYKVVLRNGEAVAVKKVSVEKDMKIDGSNQEEAAYDAFRSEVVTLGKIWHKNIVKLWCCCCHMDYKLLVCEYMPNGSLGDLLHSSKARLLDWPTRYKIALDASEGLCYLHHECVPPIVHRDVKSNNILLDAEFRAKVGDFGVSNGKGPKSMSSIAGSRGYIAPEYPYTLRMNEKSDIYSFGVVILELVTGKRAVDPEFGKDLVRWVCGTIHQKGEESIIDSKLDLRYKMEITKVLHIGLLCTSSLAINRPSMRRVVKMLLDVRTEMKPAVHLSNVGKLSSYYFQDDLESFA